MADPANALCTTARVKAMLGDTGSTYTTELEGIVGAVSARIANMCCRTFIGGGADVVEYVDVGDARDFVYLDRKPIVSVASVYEDSTRKYASDTLLTEDTTSVDGDYRVLDREAMLERVGSVWARGRRVLKVTYTGGYTNTTALVAALPDLAEATAMVCVYHAKQIVVGGDRRLGVSSISHGGSSTTGYTLDVPPYLRSYFDKYMHKVGV